MNRNIYFTLFTFEWDTFITHVIHNKFMRYFLFQHVVRLTIFIFNFQF